MASKNKKDFTGAIVTINDNGEIIRTTPKSSNTNTTKTSSNTSSYVSTPTTQMKQTVTMPTLSKTNQSTNDKIALFNNANQSLKNKQVEKLNEQNKNGGLFKSGSSNVLEGYANTMWDTGLNVGKGFFQTLEGLADFLQYKASDSQKIGSAALEKIIGKNPISDFYSGTSNWLKENAKFDSTGSLFGTNENAQDTLFGNQWRNDINEKSYLGDMGDSIGEGIGNIGAMAALSAVGGEALGAAGIGTTGAGTLTTGGKLLLSGGSSYTTAYGNARSEAYRNGATDDEANKYAIVSGLSEAVSEQFFDAMPGIKSVGLADKIGIKDFLAKKIQSGAGSKMAKIFTRLAGGLEEGGEEMISNALTAMGNDIMHMMDESYNYGIQNNSGNPLEDGWNALFSEDSLKSFMSAGFTSAILGFGGDILNASQKQQIINAYAEDNNISKEEATKQINQMIEAKENQTTEQAQENAQNFENTVQNEENIEQTPQSTVETVPVETTNEQIEQPTIEEQPKKQETKQKQRIREDIRPTSKELSFEEQRKLDRIRKFRNAGMYASISKEQFLKNNYYSNTESETGLTREQVGEMFDNAKTKEYKQLYDKMNELYRNEEVEKYIPLEERGDFVYNAYDKNLTYKEMEQNLINAINNRAGKEIVKPTTITKPKGRQMTLDELSEKLVTKPKQEVKQEKPKGVISEGKRAEWTKNRDSVIEHMTRIANVSDGTSHELTSEQKLELINDALEMGGFEKITELPNAKQKVQQKVKENNNIAERKADNVVKSTKEQTSKEITDDLNNIIQGKDTEVKQETKKSNKKEDFETIKRDIEKQTGKKMRSFIETATEAEKTTDLIRAMDEDKITYERLSNKKTVQDAKTDLKDLSYDERVEKGREIFDSEKRVTAKDIAMLHQIAQEALDMGDYETYKEMTEYRAILTTESGQVSQAAAIIQNSDPITQLDTLKKIIKREQRKGNKIYNGVVIDEDLVKAVRDTYDSKTGKYNKAEFDEAMDNLKQNIADQMKVRPSEKLNSWRYLSMLGNPKTHIRNVSANIAMIMLQSTKNRVASAIESITPDFAFNKVNKLFGGGDVEATRGKTLKTASKDVRNYAKETIDNYFKENKESNKYNDDVKTLKKDLERRRKMFSNKHPLGALANLANELNDKALNWEDNVFNKMAAKNSLTNFLAANGIETKADIEANPDLMDQALNYALFKGQEATFHQYSRTGESLRNFRESLRGNDNRIAQKLGKGGSTLSNIVGLGIDTAIPFINTPINIAKTGIEYTPGIGLLKAYSDIKNAPQNLKADVFVDGLSKRFAGGMLAAVGYALASMGAIRGKGKGDKEDKLEKDLGQQDYSILIDDGNGHKNTYDLSWLSPSAMPLFVGVELYNTLKENKEINPGTVMDALANTIDPLSEMSVISSAMDTLKTYSGNNTGQAVAYNMISNYLSQYLPTVMGQLASAFDDKQRQYKNSGDSLPQTIINQAKYKIPGARNTLPEKVDVWGETKNNVNPFESFLLPANRREYRVDETTKALEELESRTKDTQTSVLPTIISTSATPTINGTKYPITGYELVDYKKTWGKSAKSEVKNMLEDKDFINADDETKEKMISSLYGYSTYKAKKQYSDNNNIDYTDKNGNKYAIVDAFNIPYYELESLRLTDIGKKKDKQKVIGEANLTQEQKDIINLIQTYKYYDTDVDSLIRKINNSNLSKSQKQQLIAKIKKNSTKGGK